MYEAVFRDVGLAPGMAYCDLGCGAGLAAQMAAQRGARVWGLDAAEDLLRIARSRVPAGHFQVGELQELPFQDGQFDVVTGFNSFQYAADPVAALAEARRVTRKGQPVVILTWGEPQGMEAAALVAALKPLLPPPPPGAPGPFALSDASALKELATKAGLTPVRIGDVECQWDFPDLAAGVRGLGSAGVAVRAAEHAGQQAVDQAHAQALARFAQGDGHYRLKASFRWLVAAA
jgi:SAM-dependent methyltransferase